MLTATADIPPAGPSAPPRDRDPVLDDLDAAVRLLERAARALDPSLLHSASARRLLTRSARVRNLADALDVALAPCLVGRDTAHQLAEISGSAVWDAKRVLKASEHLADAPRAAEELAAGNLSLAQAAEIAKTEAEVPGSEGDLLAVAQTRPLAVLRETAKAIRQDACDVDQLDEKRRRARHHRHWTDELGMVRYSGAMLPEVGVPFMARLDAETDRVFREAGREGRHEDRSAYAADAFARMVQRADGSPRRSRRPELVVVVDVDTLCDGRSSTRPPGARISKIPGVGPVSPATVREIAKDAIVSAVLYEGTEFVKIKRWSRAMPVEIATALELGAPPEFDGRRCRRCGRRFHLEADHVDPHANGGAMSVDNLQTLCGDCHAEKTDHDRRDGLLGRDPPSSPPRRVGAGLRSRP